MNLSRCKHCGAIAHYAKSVTDPHLCWSIQCSDCGISTPSYSQQEMAAAAWERTAAAQKYGHRNGETEAPTTPGAYWIRGHDNVWKHANGISVWDIRTESHQPVNFYSAQWWGPIVAPWEQSQ